MWVADGEVGLAGPAAEPRAPCWRHCWGPSRWPPGSARIGHPPSGACTGSAVNTAPAEGLPPRCGLCLDNTCPASVVTAPPAGVLEWQAGCRPSAGWATSHTRAGQHRNADGDQCSDDDLGGHRAQRRGTRAASASGRASCVNPATRYPDRLSRSCPVERRYGPQIDANREQFDAERAVRGPVDPRQLARFRACASIIGQQMCTSCTPPGRECEFRTALSALMFSNVVGCLAIHRHEPEFVADDPGLRLVCDVVDG